MQRVLPDGHADVLVYDDSRVEVVGLHDEVDLAAGPTSSYDRVELNRAGTLRDLATGPTSSYDRVELNRAGTMRDLATQPSK